MTVLLTVGQFVKDDEPKITVITTHIGEDGAPGTTSNMIGLPVFQARILRDQLTAILKNLDGEE